MPEAKVRFLKVRPIQSSDLAFNMSGVIEEHFRDVAVLGGRVEGFSLSQLYEPLHQTDESGRLLLNATEIRRILSKEKNVALFSLRAESLAASLEQIINRRQSAFLRTFKHKTEIVDEYRKLYPSVPTDLAAPTAKLERLKKLEEHIDKIHEGLRAAYTEDNRLEVVKNSVSSTLGSSSGNLESTTQGDSKSTAESTGSSTITTEGNSNESSTSEQSNTANTKVNIAPLGAENQGSTHKYRETPLSWNQNAGKWQALELEGSDFLSQRTDVKGSGSATITAESSSNSTATSQENATTKSSIASSSESTQTSKNEFTNETRQKLVEYRHPSEEHELRFQRRHLDLQDERISHRLFSLRVPYMETLIDNELQRLDLEIKQIQLNYIHTFLVSPISGLITGIYKDVGESVKAGEAVLRIENDEEVYITGQVNYRGRLDVGSAVTIISHNAFESGETVKLSGSVAAVRGHDADNDEWNVIFRCDNRDVNDPSMRKFPLNYTFDHHDVSITIG